MNVGSLVRRVKRSIVRAEGVHTSVLDFSCHTGDPLPAGEGCASWGTSQNLGGKCFGTFAQPIIADGAMGLFQFDLSLLGLDIEMWVQPDIFDIFCCNDKLNRGVEFRGGVVRHMKGEPFDVPNLFDPDAIDEENRRWIHRWHKLWWVSPEIVTPRAAPGYPGFPTDGSCHTSCDENGIASGNGPFWPGADQTGTVTGGIASTVSLKEPHPLNMKFKTRRVMHFKGDERLSFIMQWSEPAEGCNGAAIDFECNFMGKIETRVSKL